MIVYVVAARTITLMHARLLVYQLPRQAVVTVLVMALLSILARTMVVLQGPGAALLAGLIAALFP